VNPTVDSMMAAMRWRRGVEWLRYDPRATENAMIAELLAEHRPRRLAPRWQVPAIKRRKAGV
jgi:hypothetical protein